MVFLLGRMGDNRRALNLIIERLGDVNRVSSINKKRKSVSNVPTVLQAIDFAKEQHDDDLWEDLLRYSETRPGPSYLYPGNQLLIVHFSAFIRGLLENVGAEIDPIRIIRRIKNGLEIPGLKGALIKILHDFNLQVSLLEGCQEVLDGDCADLAQRLHKNQTAGFFLSGKIPSFHPATTKADKKINREADVPDMLRPTHREPPAAATSVPVPARRARALRMQERAATPPYRSRSQSRRTRRHQREDCIVSSYSLLDSDWC